MLTTCAGRFIDLLCLGPWASGTHLELDGIYTLPLFDRSLVLVHSVYEQSNSAKLKQLLQYVLLNLSLLKIIAFLLTLHSQGASSAW
jgi:hypothetical protein